MLISENELTKPVFCLHFLVEELTLFILELMSLSLALSYHNISAVGVSGVHQVYVDPGRRKEL